MTPITHHIMPDRDQVMGAEEGGHDLMMTSFMIILMIVRILHHGIGCSIHLKPPGHLVECHPHLPGVGTNICLLFVNLPLSEDLLA